MVPISVIRKITLAGFIFNPIHATTVNLRLRSYGTSPAPSESRYAPWTPQPTSFPYPTSYSYSTGSDLATTIGSSSPLASQAILPPSPTPPYPNANLVTLSLFGYHHANCTTFERPPPITAVYLTEDRCIDTPYPFESYYVAADQGGADSSYDCQVTVFGQKACSGGQKGDFPVHGGYACVDLGMMAGRQNVGGSAMLTCPIGGL